MPARPWPGSIRHGSNVGAILSCAKTECCDRLCGGKPRRRANLAGTIVRVWERELAAITALPDLRENLQRQGLTPAYRTSAETAALIETEIARWRGVAEKAALKPE
jgi:hypothetical protein